MEKAYEDVVNLVSPGQQHLTSDSLRSVFNWLENRVHCGEVPCEKVSFIRATRSAGDGCSPTAGEGERSRSNTFLIKLYFLKNPQTSLRNAQKLTRKSIENSSSTL